MRAALRFRSHNHNKQDLLDPKAQRLVTIYERKFAALDELKKSLLHHAFFRNL